MLLQIAPYFGYLASVFLIIALLVNGDIKFRLFNILGTISFIIYGIIFHAWPVLLTNVILFGINLFYLFKLYQHKENFEPINFSGDEKLTAKFLQFYADDIKTYFPTFDKSQLQGNLNFVVLRDLVIANIFSATIAENGDATVTLNYTIKKYRDFKVGKYIFEKEKQWLTEQRIKRIVYNDVHNKAHAVYLITLGFKKVGIGYVKTL